MIAATLHSVEQINNTTFSFWFQPQQPVEYTAGQFVELFIPHDADDRGTHRWFTLSSSPSEKLIAITTRKSTRPSSFKHQLFNLKIGDSVRVSQAMGDFVLPMQKSIPIIFLIRGIGATPVRSMLKYLQDIHESRNISIVYSLRPHDQMFTDVLNTQNEIIYHESGDNNDVEEPTTTVSNLTKKSPSARVYVSGPEQFVEVAYKRLLENDIKGSSVVTDYFHGYDA
jgi:ferredoxin-NADP reductase